MTWNLKTQTGVCNMKVTSCLLQIDLNTSPPKHTINMLDKSDFANFTNMKTIPEIIIQLFGLQESQGDISHAVGLLTTQTVEMERGPEEASTAEHPREASNQRSSKIITEYITQIICTVL